MYIYTSLRASRAGAIRGPRTVLAVGGPLGIGACCLVLRALHDPSQTAELPLVTVTGVP